MDTVQNLASGRPSARPTARRFPPIGIAAALIVTAIVAMVTAAGAPAQAQLAGYIEIGTETIRDGIDRHVINVARREGGFEGLKIRVARGGVLIQKLTIEPQNGAAQSFRVTRFMEEGQETEVIPLTGPRRFLKTITLEYGTIDVRGRGAEVTLFAKPVTLTDAEREQIAQRDRERTEARRQAAAEARQRARERERARRREQRRQTARAPDTAAAPDAPNAVEDRRAQDEPVIRRRAPEPLDRDRTRDERRVARSAPRGRNPFLDDDDTAGRRAPEPRDRRRAEFDDRDENFDDFDRSARSDRRGPVDRARPDDDAAELVVVGTLNIRGSRDADDLDLRGQRRFSAVAIQARGGAVRIREITVRLADGTRVRTGPAGVLQSGDITRIFELNRLGRAERVLEVTVLADALAVSGGRTELVVLMREERPVDDLFADRRGRAGDRRADRPADRRFDDFRDDGDFDRGRNARNARDARPDRPRGNVVVGGFPELSRAWTSLGVARQNRRRARLVVPVGIDVGRLNAMLFRVTGGDVEINRVRVRFGRGRPGVFTLDREFADGDQSPVYALRRASPGRFVREIELEARVIGRGRPDVRIEVMGRRASDF